MNEKNDNTKKRFFDLLPYIIIEGVIFLLLPLFMGAKAGALTYIIELGAFPLTAIGCAVHFALFKKKRDILICVIAPVFYAISALIYGMWRDSWFTVLIYLIAYLVCGYLGLMLSDLLRPKNKKEQPEESKPIRRAAVKRPQRVNVEKHEEPAETFKPEDPAQDNSLDTSTTDDDIEAILAAIHSRRSN